MFLWSSLLLINLLGFQTVYSTSVTLDKDNFHKEIKNGIAFVLFTNPSGNKSSELYMVWKALSFRFSDTRSVKIGDIDCKAYWKAILTPYGACYVMKITNNEERFPIDALISDWPGGPSREHQIESFSKNYMTADPFNQANSVLGLVVAINKTDSSFGWHGLR